MAEYPKDALVAPWAPWQVDALNAWQKNDRVHPFTASDGDILRATRDGWIHPVTGEVVQKWAHDFMARYCPACAGACLGH